MERKKITTAEHQRLIAAYARERPAYEQYAAVLRRVLERACQVSIPQAFVQSRAKTTSSFAEKCARKFDKYDDCLRDMTDLCGARVIVQTLEQVEAVAQFVEANFEILEKDEKGVSLGEERFGYRDLHYIVRLDATCAGALGITDAEVEPIGARKAELQVRTWLQHAWADTLHDRIYKAPLHLSGGIRRSGNLLAALMEEGDRNYDALAHELDGMIANYAAFAERAAVENEIAAQRLILDNEPDATKRPLLALRLGRLLAACGDYAGVIAVLGPHEDSRDADRCELLQDLGYALCKAHRAEHGSEGYRRGRELLERALDVCGAAQGAFVEHRRRRESRLARCTARLAWTLEVMPGETPRARELYARAHEYEPRNPYYLADMLGFEVFCTRVREPSRALRTRLREARQTCRAHAEHGIELPRAFFTAARVGMLLDEPLDALGYYARGIRHCLAGTHCVPGDALRIERQWIERLHAGIAPPDSHRWVMDLLDMAESISALRVAGAGAATPRAVMVAGGAASMSPEMLARCRPLLETALMHFAGRVVSGGTAVGVSGCVGDVAEALDRQGARRFETIGYIPKRLPHDARYDRTVVVGETGFTPEQALRSWKDLSADGIAPAEVLCLGFGGGLLSAVDHQIALALGAGVVVALGSGGAADAIAADPLWSGTPNLMPLPTDEATFRSLLAPSGRGFDDDTLHAMASEIHGRYVADAAHRLPDNLRPWSELDETFRAANVAQARHAVRILEAVGFIVEPAADPARPVVFDADRFTPDEVERIAELEHGRWNVERVRAGWRFGRARDDARRVHDSIVSWADLPDSVKAYDRNAVRAFPSILAVAGLEVRRTS